MLSGEITAMTAHADDDLAAKTHADEWKFTLGQLLLGILWLCVTLVIGVQLDWPVGVIIGCVLLFLLIVMYGRLKMAVNILCLACLLAILIPTVVGGFRKSVDATTALEVADLTQAMEAYRMHTGDYPPDFSDADEIRRHIARAFPRNQDDVDAWLHTLQLNRDPRDLDAAEALVFWLSEVSDDPYHPLTGTSDHLSFYDFFEVRLSDVDKDGWPEYASRRNPSVPYVFFNERTAVKSRYPRQPLPEILGVARVYRRAGTNSSFGNRIQVISAGRDNDYGVDRTSKMFPTGDGYGKGDYDNITSFSKGRPLEDSLPSSQTQVLK